METVTGLAGGCWYFTHFKTMLIMGDYCVMPGQQKALKHHLKEADQ